MIYPLIMGYVLMDCLQMVGQGLINGIGKQAVAAILTFFGFWIMGIPVACILVFRFDAGLPGLWVGPVLSLTFCFVAYYVLLVKVDWREQIR